MYFIMVNYELTNQGRTRIEWGKTFIYSDFQSLIRKTCKEFWFLVSFYLRSKHNVTPLAAECQPFLLHCYRYLNELYISTKNDGLVKRKWETSFKTKTRTTLTEVLALWLVEYGMSSIMGYWNMEEPSLETCINSNLIS